MSKPSEWTTVQWLSEIVANYLEHCRAEFIRPCQEFEQALRRLIVEHGILEKKIEVLREHAKSIDVKDISCPDLKDRRAIGQLMAIQDVLIRDFGKGG